MGFEQDVKFEQSQFEIADNFYRNEGYSQLQRSRIEDATGRILQYQDIDVILYKGDTRIAVSEKFSRQEDGNFIVELYHPRTVHHKGSTLTSKSDWINYFFCKGKKMYSVQTKQVQKWLQRNKDVLESEANKLLQSKNYKSSIFLDLYSLSEDRVNAKITFFKDKEGFIILIIPWQDLRDKFGINYTQYSLPEEFQRVLSDEEILDIVQDRSFLAIARKVEQKVLEKIRNLIQK